MKREAEERPSVEALDEVMGSPDDLRPYMLRDRWSLFELACLLHGAAPELVSGRAHADKQRQLRALDEPHEAWTPKLVRDLCDTAP